MKKKDAILIGEIVGYSIIVYVLLWALVSFISPETFESIKFTKRVVRSSSPFWSSPTMGNLPVGYVITLYIFLMLLISSFLFYIVTNVEKNKNPGGLINFIVFILSVYMIIVSIKLFSTSVFLSVIGVVLFFMSILLDIILPSYLK